MGKASRKKGKQVEKGTPPEIIALPSQGIVARALAALFLLSLLVTLIYSNTFSAPFVFDDIENIVDNPQVKDLKNFLYLSGSRYVGYLSFALNHHFGGLHVFGYHLVNLLIHIINGFLVYLLVRLLFRIPMILSSSSNPQDPASNISHQAPSIAFVAAFLFVAHPVQTQAVTYIVQRFASLVALFYLLTLVCYLKWRLASPDARSRYLWYAGALLSTVLAMKTKENSFTLPFMILLVEAVFFRPFTRKRWVALIPFLLTLLIIPVSRGDALGEAEGFARDATAISRSDYLFTQFRVIITYLRLLVLPINQNLDYDYPIYHSLFEPSVFLSFLFLLSLFALSLFLIFDSRLTTRNSQLRCVAFGVLWFFLTLSIESSIIPIRDVIFEHRLYLPSVGLFLAVGLGIMMAGRWCQRKQIPPVRGMVGLGVLALLLSVVTYQRNMVWRDDLTLWQNVVKRAPNNARGHNNLAMAYHDKRDFETAIQEYQMALKLQPAYPEPHYNLGNVYAGQGRLEDAIQEYQMALKLQPAYAKVYNSLGNVYATQGRLEEAIEAYQAALGLKRDFFEAHYNLGHTYVTQESFKEAIEEYQVALKLRPDLAEAQNRLGHVYATQGRLEEAIEAYQAALERQGDLVGAHYNLGNAYATQGRPEAAIQAYQLALKLQPYHAKAHNNLGNAYATQGRLEEAIKEYRIAFKLQPDLVEAYINLGSTYVAQGRFEEAIKVYRNALRLQPDIAEVYKYLGNVYRQQGRIDEANEAFQRALKIKRDFPTARQALEPLPISARPQ